MSCVLNLWTVVIGSLLLGTVYSKTCTCGSNCDAHKGYKTEDKCFFIARMNPLHGKQFLISNEQEETFVLKNLFNKKSTSDHVLIGTDQSYVLKQLHSACMPRRCTQTIYYSNCHCTLNFFEKTWQEAKHLYDKYPEVFWTIISVVLALIMIIALKCILC